VSPQSSSYLTGGAWSPTRPAVLLVSSDSGEMGCNGFCVVRVMMMCCAADGSFNDGLITAMDVLSV
jgi:hypothetical protein